MIMICSPLTLTQICVKYEKQRCKDARSTTNDPFLGS